MPQRMEKSGVSIDSETLNRIREKVLQEEQEQLHFNRPPSILNDIEEIISNEITEVDLDED
jgi:hypothetical protein